jgi:TonB family protein
MSETCRESVICHELLHVRRRDWAVILVEELIRSIYWFHPAVWWLLGRIHLAREQLVDHEVVRLTGNRQPYLDSLLEIAQSRGRPRAVPMPLFLKEGHLVQRVALLIKEVSMNPLRLTVSLAGIALLLAGTIRLAAGWFPLTGTPVVVKDGTADTENKASQRPPIRIGGDAMESRLIHKVDPIYPDRAKAIGLSGRVVLALTVNEEGFVSDVRITSGHPFLTDAAVMAVKQWRYSPTLLNGVPVPVATTVTVAFALKNDKAEAGSGSDAPPMPPIKLMGSLNRISAGQDWFMLFKAAPIDDKGSPLPDMQDYRAPEVTMTPEVSHRWLDMVETGWPAGMAKGTPLSYSFIINESGALTDFAREQGPEIPDLERELALLRVVSPGLRGSALVSSRCVLEIWIGLSMDDVQRL